MKNFLQLLFISLLFVSCGKEKVDRMYVNAKIWTGDTLNPSATVIAVKGEKIVYVGDDATKFTANETIDVQGKQLLPGFTDNHTHFLSAGYALSSVKLKDAMTKEEFIKRIAEFCKSKPDDTWVMEGSWDHENWGGELPSKEWVDSVTGDHPLFISRYDSHMAFANSKALELAGINKNTVAPLGGVVVKNKDGEPTGVVKDAAMTLVINAITPPTNELLDQYFDAAAKHAVERGVTNVTDMNSFGGWSDLETYRRAWKTDRMILRMYSFVPLATWERMDSFVQKNGRGDDMLHWGGLKGYVDGSLGSTTAWFHQPYLDDPKTSGLFITDTALLRKWVMGADKAKLHLAVHAIGDKANDFILSIYENALKVNGERDRRSRVEHAQHVTKQTIDQFAKLGVIASMHPYHLYDDGIWAYKRLDTNRLKGTYAFKSMKDKGVKITFGSDWPVAPIDPVYGIYSAVTRITGDGKNPNGWYPDEKLSIEDALKAYTATNAYASFLEDKIGILKEGFYADFTILENNLFEVPKEKIKDIKALRTVLKGKEVFLRK
jgi:predicted amidohydrolase YtcJ